MAASDVADTDAHEEGGKNTDNAAGHVQESGGVGLVADVLD